MRTPSVVLATAILAALASHADASRVFVVQSDIPAYRPQSVLEADHVLVIPANRSLVVLRPDGSEQKLTASDSGRPVRVILENVVEAPWWQRMLDLIRGGGAQPRQGSARSLSMSPDDYTTAAGRRSGIVCAMGTTGPNLTRPASAAQRALTVEIEGPSGAKSTATFAASATTTAWPADQTGAGTYAVRPANQPPFQVALKALPAATGVAQVRALGAAGCEAQAADALKALAR
jgi:hypothetical protein